MKKVLIILLIVFGSVYGQSTVVSLSAASAITLQKVTLDSVQITNVSTGETNTIIGKTEFDLNTLSRVNGDSRLPINFDLSENFPNSFAESTRFYLFMPKPDNVSIRVFNVLGEIVVQNTMHLQDGSHLFNLDMPSIASGVYFVQAKNSDFTKSIKMTKTGSHVGAPSSLTYVGQAGTPQFLQKVANPGDTFSFVAYADGFVQYELKNQVLFGGETVMFSMLPVPPPDDFTSNWRGFNLLGLFTVEWAEGEYLEEDFINMSDFGFNFARLPIDYRTYVSPDDWLDFDENKLSFIDDAVEWGREYGIHVCINLHRAPGYCVNSPSTPLPADQDKSLWTDKEAQDAFTEHWRMFAERYNDVPTKDLSFNLVNEPADIDGNSYVNAMLGAIEAIREISPDRIIISDAVDWGNARVDEILEYGIVMSPHFYNPFGLTHYKASWVNGSDTWAVPTWPVLPMSNYFYAPAKSPWNTPLELSGNFPAGTKFIVHVNQVSASADFRIQADGSTIFRKNFQPGPGEGEWETVIYREEWNVYQNIYNRDYSVELTDDATDISMLVVSGDWMTFSSLTIDFPDGYATDDIYIAPGLTDWGVPQASYLLTSDGKLTLEKAPSGFEDKFVTNGFLQQWVELKNQGTPVHVGEWGVYNKTPHDVTIAFMRDRLAAMQSAGLGWAVWNFRGSFGILDSGRKDVDYENYYGRKLDREMLELLQEFLD